MKLERTGFEGLFVIEPKVFGDQRGYFFESFNLKVLNEHGIHYDFVQDNQSKSSYGVIRGLHYQLEPHAQTKLIRALSGTILDVVVDIRQGSSTFGKKFCIELSDENKKQLLIPKGFAHGFSVLSESAEILYKCDAFYCPDSEAGIHINDPSLEIDWKISLDKQKLSEKDVNLPLLTNAEMNFKL
jgi:dTDP-4-dehydrorhamnose 3,5-epimerase